VYLPCGGPGIGGIDPPVDSREPRCRGNVRWIIVDLILRIGQEVKCHSAWSQQDRRGGGRPS